MRILFVINLIDNDYFTQSRILKLIEVSAKNNDVIAIIDGNDRISINRLKNVVSFSSLSEITQDNLDIVIFNDSNCLNVIRSKVKTKPIVFLSAGNHLYNSCRNLPNLYGVFVLDTNQFKLNNIPNEYYLYLNVTSIRYYKNRFKSSKISVSRAVYFYDDENISLARSVIIVFNSFPYVQLTIVSSPRNALILKEIANKNISFSTLGSSLNKFYQKNDFVIASKEFARSSLINKMPTIVLGINGLGGLVISENIKDFCRTNFEGRVGGVKNEPVPLDLLEFEIKHTQHEIIKARATNCSLIRDSDYLSFKRFIIEDWVALYQSKINEISNLYNYISNKKLFLLLTPRVTSNIIIKYNEYLRKSMVINKLTGKVLGGIGNDEHRILGYCTGNRNVAEILVENKGFSETDIIAFFLELWKKKIIILKNLG